jgi:hypothetical protein
VIVRPAPRAFGTPAPAWYFAEGATGGFDLFFLLANPGFRPAGARLTVWLDAEFPQAAGQRFGAVVESLSGGSLIVERSTYGGPDR